MSLARDKVRFFHTLFAARRDVYATRWENVRSGRSGWMPAVRGGWRKGTSRPYLHMTDEVLAAHLTGDVHIGLYPLLDGDVCHWLAADFDGGSAMLDALSYLKAARAIGVPAALEVSRSGVGAHVWIFFAGPVPAATARALGTGLLGEAIALRGRMDLSSYDRLFPSQDVLPGSGGVGNLIAAPLQGRSRRDGATVFLDLATMEPHEDQWAYLKRAGERGRCVPTARFTDHTSLPQLVDHFRMLTRTTRVRVDAPDFSSTSTRNRKASARAGRVGEAEVGDGRGEGQGTAGARRGLACAPQRRVYSSRQAHLDGEERSWDGWTARSH